MLKAIKKIHPDGYQNYGDRPMSKMQGPYYYRNKAQLQVRMINGQVAAGLYRRGTHDLVDLPTFCTQRPLTMKVMRQLCRIIENLGIPVYDEKSNRGIIKTLIVREAAASNQVQVTVVTNSKQLLHQRAFIQQVTETCPEVVSLLQNINPGRTSLIWGAKTKLVFGVPQIIEQIGDKKFKLSARAFFQLNSLQTAKLYQAIAKALNLNQRTKLLDAYCGAGTIGIYLANQVAQVRGMDVIPEAIEDAKQNARFNHCFNTYYECGKAEEVIPRWLRDGFKPDAIVVDPPRTGLDQSLISSLMQAKAADFVYVSCNPSTLARDLVKMASNYQVEYLQPFDMFPQTARIEVLVKLKLKI